MKNYKKLCIAAFCAALGLTAGCSQQEPASPTTPGPKTTATTATQSVDAVKATPAPVDTRTVQTAPSPAADVAAADEALKKKAAEEKAALEKAAADQLAEGVKAAMVAANNVPGLIDSAKQLVGEDKYAEALKILNALASMKLTPEQQKLVDALKDQAAKATAQKATSEAEKAMGGLLKK